MSSEKFKTVNDLIAVTKASLDLFLMMRENVENGSSLDEEMRKGLSIRRDVVLAAQAVAAAPDDPEAERIIGSVFLGSVDSAVRAISKEDWETCADEAIKSVGIDSAEAETRIKDWMELSGPIIDLGVSVMGRAQEQQIEIMLEGFRRGAEQTPNSSLRITETVGDTLISDETILGPELGQEDSPNLTVGRVSSSLEVILGIDDDRMETDLHHLIQQQAQLVIDGLNLPATSRPDDVWAAVSKYVLSKIEVDLKIAKAIGDLPSPIEGLGTQHFPALRAQLLLQHTLPLSEGSTLSRAKRGDPSAESLMMQLTIVSDMLNRAEPYFLPLSQMDTPAHDQQLVSLPPEQSFLVWHDTALRIGDGVNILAWLFATDKDGVLFPLAHVIRTVEGGGALDASWCSLRQGQAASTAQKIARLLRTPEWEAPPPLRLPRPVGGKEWHKAVPRSAARLKTGALHGLRTLPPRLQ